MTSPRISTRHHGSHRGLLRPPPPTLPKDVDAVVVPTARDATAMRSAIELAAKLNSTLVALCSKSSTAAGVAGLREAKGVKLVAIDAGDLPEGVLPVFETCRRLAGTQLERPTDTSAKRNLGLLLSRLIGWRRIVFLDDDITVPEPLDLRDAVGLTSRFAGVGLRIDGMPDNSVVCHAYREAGGRQDMFVGSGALAVAVDSTMSFFPNIYNEDWFFLLDDDGLRSTTSTGSATQKPYDPFATVERARREEFGDCLAEGLFWLLDKKRSLKNADHGYWETFLIRRGGFIDDVMAMVDEHVADSLRRVQMLGSLEAARARNRDITAKQCADYLEAWRRDRVTWQDHVAALLSVLAPLSQDQRTVAGVAGLLGSLGLASFHVSLPEERFDHDPADFHLPPPAAVGQ